MFITPGCPKQPPGHPHLHGHSPLGPGNPALHQVQVFLGGPLYLREMFREEGVAMRQAPPRHCWRSCAPWCRGQTLPVLAAPTSTAGLSPCRVTKPEGFCSWGAHQTLVSVLPGGSSSCRSCSGSRQGAGVHPSHMGEGRGLFSVILHLQLPPREVAMEQALWSPLVTRTMPPRWEGGSMGCPSPQRPPLAGESCRVLRVLQAD